MKAYFKPEMKEVELFTKEAISLTIPKTKYTKSAGVWDDGTLLAVALGEGEYLSGNGKATSND